MDSYTGTSIEVSFAEFVRRRDAEVRRRLRLFGDSGFDGVFAWGPRRDLIGREVRAVPAGRRPSYQVELDVRSGYASFSPDAATVPAYVTGRLSGSPAEARSWGSR